MVNIYNGSKTGGLTKGKINSITHLNLQIAIPTESDVI